MTYDVIVIGSGPGGYVAAIRCAQLGLKTACVEKGPLGGTCLNVGCIPSKALLHSSELLYKLDHHLPQHGINIEKASFDFDKMMGRKRDVVTSFNQGIAALFKKNKIDHLQGTGTLKSPTTVTVDGTDHEATYIILATGSEPISLPFLPIDEKRVVTSTGALSLDQVPKKLLVIGAGVIGVELGSVYKRLGSEVTFIEFLPKICPTIDDTISKAFQKILEKQGMTFHLNTKVTSADIAPDKITLTTDKETFEGDVVLCSIGRRPYIEGLGLENVGITPNKGFIPINGRFQTTVPNIYAIGDIVDGPMLAHKASEEGVAVAEILANENPSIDYIAIPSVVYTDPEVAAVGLTELEAKDKGLDVITGSFPFSINSRAKCTAETEGLVKIISDAKTDILLGIHIVGAHASEIIAEAVLAIQNKVTALDLANTPHAHPTLSEAVKEAALDVHKRAIHK
ncbi:MAG: dihydrolipoyl dehydrogenase [Simkaniaceae bacterium]|nr:dihydrolipoyl dehydrogenase [Candidatus Sacchlamyda saccharinae]